MASPRRVDLSGKTFGRWTVVEFDRINAGRLARWWVRCACGARHSVIGHTLTNGRSQGCAKCAARLPQRLASIAKGRAHHQAKLRALAAARVSSGSKKCSHCNGEFPLGEFWLIKRALDGRSTWCRTCNADYQTKKKFGIGSEEKAKMIRDQGGRCANRGCGEELSLSSHMDHCHRTDRIRGILCHRCNTCLGTLGEDAERIEGLAAYARERCATAA